MNWMAIMVWTTNFYELLFQYPYGGRGACSTWSREENMTWYACIHRQDTQHRKKNANCDSRHPDPKFLYTDQIRILNIFPRNIRIKLTSMARKWQDPEPPGFRPLTQEGYRIRGSKCERNVYGSGTLVRLKLDSRCICASQPRGKKGGGGGDFEKK